MRKLILLYYSIVLLLSCFMVGQVEALMTVEDIEVAEVSEVQEKVEYSLPWPGILPDHPFYFLKVLRDRVWGFLVRDPLKKAEWALLMADKRVWAGQMLVEKGKETLGVSTLTKAEKYLEQALVKAEEAKAQGGNVDSFLGKLGRASLKHEEILGEVLDLVSEESQAVIERMIEYPEKVYEGVEELRK